MQPKVSIVIPVYNVEKYLRKCLDSVVNQTLRDIQIICINDGSTDHSRAILQEYADMDSRLEIIDKPNGGGPGAARNFAYPYIRGTYTLFVDSDDYLDIALCGQTVGKADEVQADFVAFSYESFPGRGKNPFASVDREVLEATTPLDRLDEKIRCGLFTLFVTPWCKLFRSDFLFQNKIDFPEYAYFDDNSMNWKAIVLARKILFLPEKLYYYRLRFGSIMRPKSKKYLDGVKGFLKAKQDMIDCGVYDEIRDYFLNEWLGHLRTYYRLVSNRERPAVRKRILESLGNTEWDFLKHSAYIKPKLRSFYGEIQKPFSWKNRIWILFSNTIEKFKTLLRSQ